MFLSQALVILKDRKINFEFVFLKIFELVRKKSLSKKKLPFQLHIFESKDFNSVDSHNDHARNTHNFCLQHNSLTKPLDKE